MFRRGEPTALPSQRNRSLTTSLFGRRRSRGGSCGPLLGVLLLFWVYSSVSKVVTSGTFATAITTLLWLLLASVVVGVLAFYLKLVWMHLGRGPSSSRATYLIPIPTKPDDVSALSTQPPIREYTNLQITNVDTMDPFQFEHYVAELLKLQGFQDIVVTQSSNDWGADIIAQRGAVKYAIQVKRWTKNVTERAIYEAQIGMRHYQCPACMVITNSDFTPRARELAQEYNCMLVDGRTLASWVHQASMTRRLQPTNPQPPVQQGHDTTLEPLFTQLEWLQFLMQMGAISEREYIRKQKQLIRDAGLPEGW